VADAIMSPVLPPDLAPANVILSATRAQRSYKLAGASALFSPYPFARMSRRRLAQPAARAADSSGDPRSGLAGRPSGGKVGASGSQ